MSVRKLSPMRAVLKSIGLLDKKTKRKLLVTSFLSFSTSILDLIAVGIVGAVVALSIQSLDGAPVGDRVYRVLNYLNLLDSAFAFQIGVLLSIAVVFLIVRSVASLIISRKIFLFLNYRAIYLTRSLLFGLFVAPSQDVISKKGSQGTLFALSAGVGHITTGILGSASLIVTDIILFVSLSVGIFLADFATALVALLVYLVVISVLYFKVNISNKRLAKSLTQLTISNNQRILELFGVYKELFVRNSWKSFVSAVIDDRKKFVYDQAQLKLIPIFNKYVVEIISVLVFAMVCIIQFTQNDSARAAGNVALFAVASSRIIPALLRIQQNVISISGSTIAAESTFELFEELNTLIEDDIQQEDYRRTHEVNPPTIELKDVRFSYDNQSEVGINSFSLTFKPRSFVAIVGRSGAGKSTLLDLILGFKAPSSGEILFDGVKLEEYRRYNDLTIGFVPQSTMLLDASIRENIFLGIPSYEIEEDWYERVLDISGVREFMEKNSISDSDRVGESGARLSAGEKQKIGLARAFINKPNLLVLDEATSSLDEISDNRFRRSLQQFYMEVRVTIFMVSHRPSSFSMANQLLVIDGGTLEAFGTFKDVLETSSTVKGIIEDSTHSAELSD